MFDLNDLGIDFDEIDKLLAEIDRELVPVIRKTPEMIENVIDPVEREKEFIEFSRLHNCFITPLTEMAKQMCKKQKLPYSEIPSFSNLSIIGRMSKMCEFLIKKGYTIDAIQSVLPEANPEVEGLFNELRSLEIPLIRKTPEMIDNNPINAEKERELAEFTLLHDLYITPLSEMAKRISIKLGTPFSEIPVYANSSIMGRMMKLREFLINKGCTFETIKQLLPTTEEEIDLLSEAKNNGFNMGYENISDLTNNNRVMRANEFLQKIQLSNQEPKSALNSSNSIINISPRR